jgi:hypothetical protein
VLLNCKFRHTKMLFSDHQNSFKSSPKSRKWHFRDSKLKNFLGPLALEVLPDMPQLCSATFEQLFAFGAIFSARATSSNYTLSNEKWYMTHSFSLFGAKSKNLTMSLVNPCASVLIFLLVQRQTILLVNRKLCSLMG